MFASCLVSFSYMCNCSMQAIGTWIFAIRLFVSHYLCAPFFSRLPFCAFVTFHFHHWISKFSIFKTILCDHASTHCIHFIVSLTWKLLHTREIQRSQYICRFSFLICWWCHSGIAPISYVLSYFCGIMCFRFQQTWAIRSCIRFLFDFSLVIIPNGQQIEGST